MMTKTRNTFALLALAAGCWFAVSKHSLADNTAPKANAGANKALDGGTPTKSGGANSQIENAKESSAEAFKSAAPKFTVANQIGTYGSNWYSPNALQIRYFAAEYNGNFTYDDARYLANQMMKRVQSRNVTHLLDRTGAHYGNYHRHLVLGFVTANGQYHWTAVRMNGSTACYWFDSNGRSGTSPGWVVRDVKVKEGYIFRYQFSVNRGRLGWAMKHHYRS